MPMINRFSSTCTKVSLILKMMKSGLISIGVCLAGVLMAEEIQKLIAFANKSSKSAGIDSFVRNRSLKPDD